MGEVAVRAEEGLEAVDLPARFLLSLDVKPSTRRTYGRALGQFTAGGHTGIQAGPGGAGGFPLHRLRLYGSG
jgi:hypothetical protein